MVTSVSPAATHHGDRYLWASDNYRWESQLDATRENHMQFDVKIFEKMPLKMRTVGSHSA
jgi:hypothetical protein